MLNFIKDLHSGQMINARVETNFVKEGESFINSLLIKCRHIFGDIRGSNHILVLLEANSSNFWVQESRNITDNDIRISHQGFQGILLHYSSLSKNKLTASLTSRGLGVHLSLVEQILSASFKILFATVTTF